MVLSVYPEDTPLSSFCRIDPNSVTVEDEALREKVMVAIHAARAAVIAGNGGGSDEQVRGI